MSRIVGLILIITLSACGNVDTASNGLGDRESMGKLTRTVKVIGANELDLAKDRAAIVSSKLEKNRLYLTIQYNGGSRDHEFELYCLNALAKSMPPKASLYLSHNANGDLAKALITKELIFELDPMTDLDKGPIVLRIFPPGEHQAMEPTLLYQP